jgi:hypothetical protein
MQRGMYDGREGSQMIGRRRTDETNLMRANAGSHIQGPLQHQHTNSWTRAPSDWMNSASFLQGYAERMSFYFPEFHEFLSGYSPLLLT